MYKKEYVNKTQICEIVPPDPMSNDVVAGRSYFTDMSDEEIYKYILTGPFFAFRYNHEGIVHLRMDRSTGKWVSYSPPWEPPDSAKNK